MALIQNYVNILTQSFSITQGEIPKKMTFWWRYVTQIRVESGQFSRASRTKDFEANRKLGTAKDTNVNT